MMSDFSARLSQAVAKVSPGVFLGEVDRTGARLTLHVRVGTDVALVRREVVAATIALGIVVDVKVRAHKVGDIASPRSIEHWLKVFASGTVVFDPTLVAQRARMLLEAAKACRREFGGAVSGIYFDASRRAMHVVVPTAVDTAERLGRQQRILAMVGGIGSADHPWPFVVHVVTTAPRGDLTPIDAASAPFLRRLARAIRRTLVPSAIVLAATSLALPAAASNSDTNSTARLVGEYGMLYSLSVFSDDQTVATGGAFTAMGLRAFFGDQSNAAGPHVRLAQTDRRTIVRDTGPDGATGGAGGPGGPGAASPGS